MYQNPLQFRENYVIILVYAFRGKRFYDVRSKIWELRALTSYL